MPHACQGLVRASGLPNADIHTYKYVVVNVETVICGDISLPEVKTVEYVVYVKPVRHGADAAGASKKEKKENTKVDIAAAATA